MDDDEFADEELAIFAAVSIADEDCAELEEDCAKIEEDCAAYSDDELLTAGVICNELDDDTITHIVSTDELDSGTYRSIWYS